MNKQQSANKIWESANKTRSKIEANEYKNYILGFNKYLSDLAKLSSTVADLCACEFDLKGLSEFKSLSTEK